MNYLLKQKLAKIHKGRKASLKTRLKMSLAHKGAKGSNWQGGLTSINIKIRHSLKYKLWREAIFKRDNWTCQECKSRGRKLNADHIKPFALILKENKINTLKKAVNCIELWLIKNGRTLCETCHKKTDTYLKNLNQKLSTT